VCFGYFELASCYISLIVIRRSEFPLSANAATSLLHWPTFQKTLCLKKRSKKQAATIGSPPILCVSDISHTGYFSVQTAGVLVK